MFFERYGIYLRNFLHMAVMTSKMRSERPLAEAESRIYSPVTYAIIDDGNGLSQNNYPILSYYLNKWRLIVSCTIGI